MKNRELLTLLHQYYQLLYFCYLYPLPIAVLEMVEKSSVNFTLYNEEVDWNTAKASCEVDGQILAVLNTTDKLTTLKQQLRTKHNFPSPGYKKN